MMAMQSEYAETKTVRLSPRMAVTLTVGAGGICCEWDPRLPRKLRPKELARYRAARDEMLGRLAERMGTRVLVVE